MALQRSLKHRACEGARSRIRLARILAAAATVAAAFGDVRLPALFSDRMVLPAGRDTAIWGWAEPGESVTVSIGGVQAQTRAAADGRWLARLDLEGVGQGPFALTVTGRNALTVQDVVIGEVWLAAGQSNMQFILSQDADAATEVPRPPDPMLRQFKVARASSLLPADDCEGEWVIAAPDTRGNFTAVGYHFARRLQDALRVPVGLINATWGGTRIAAWTHREALRTVPELASTLDDELNAAAAYPERIGAYRTQFARWMEAADRRDRPCQEPLAFATGPLSARPWRVVTVPPPRRAVPEGEPGAIWFRRTVAVPAAQAGRRGLLVFSELGGFEEVYWNGTLVGRTTLNDHPGSGYTIQHILARELVVAGSNTLAIRVFNPVGPPVLRQVAIRIENASLAGEWMLCEEYAFPPRAVPEAPVPPPSLAHPQSVSGTLFDGMIHPLVPFSIRGVIWYQGEGDATRIRAPQYRTLFPLLIGDWRRHWERPNLPFYFCQLANNGAKSAQPDESNWAELREAQSLALALPHTGQAVLIDLGEARTVHPWRKKEVGQRLARLALNGTYGQPMPHSGPVLTSWRVEAGRMRLQFDPLEGGLVAHPVPDQVDVNLSEGRREPLSRNSPDSELEGFAIRGADPAWHWAQAAIAGDSVLVWSAAVTNPAAVRYGWADNPTVNLYNRAGLPAAPFRTDTPVIPLRGRQEGHADGATRLSRVGTAAGSGLATRLRRVATKRAKSDGFAKPMDRVIEAQD